MRRWKYFNISVTHARYKVMFTFWMIHDGNPFILGSQGQSSRSWVNRSRSLHSCECWLFLVTNYFYSSCRVVVVTVRSIDCSYNYSVLTTFRLLCLQSCKGKTRTNLQLRARTEMNITQAKLLPPGLPPDCLHRLPRPFFSELLGFNFSYFSFLCRALDLAGHLVSFWAHVNLPYRIVS